MTGLRRRRWNAFIGTPGEREIRDTLADLRSLGATVEYKSVDVRDAERLACVLDDWRARFGPIAGLIHGAGVIHDKLLHDKTPESFDRVLGTKVTARCIWLD